MAYRSNPNYLFCDGDLGEALRTHAAKIREHVDTIPESRFSSTTDEELAREVAAEFTVAPIELDESGRTMAREETKVDVSGDPQRAIFHREGPVLIPGIRVRISTPFRGDPGLWKFRPSTWRTTFPYGVVHAGRGSNPGTLEVTIEQPADQPQERIKERFDDIMGDVRFYVQHQLSQIEAHKASLPIQIQTAIGQRRERLNKHDNLSELLGIPLSKASSSVPSVGAFSTLTTPSNARSRPPRTESQWDVFISHASEDKETFARPLAEGLRTCGLRVWFDEFTLRVGDSLRRSIDRGLAASTFGVVVISPAFLSKDWPQRELDGLVAREVEGRKVMLPVWHNVDATTVRRYSPTLADRLATVSTRGIDQVINDLLAAIRGD
jgi:hypothetical protein